MGKKKSRGGNYDVESASANELQPMVPGDSTDIVFTSSDFDVVATGAAKKKKTAVSAGFYQKHRSKSRSHGNIYDLSDLKVPVNTPEEEHFRYII